MQKTQKLTTLIVICILWIGLFGQDNALCKQRGHVPGLVFMTTSVYCEAYIVDTDSATLYIEPNPNIYTYTCLRCGESYTVRFEPDTTIIWEKQPEHQGSPTAERKE